MIVSWWFGLNDSGAAKKPVFSTTVAPHLMRGLALLFAIELQSLTPCQARGDDVGGVSSEL